MQPATGIVECYSRESRRMFSGNVSDWPTVPFGGIGVRSSPLLMQDRVTVCQGIVLDCPGGFPLILVVARRDDRDVVSGACSGNWSRRRTPRWKLALSRLSRSREGGS
ncbi:hypothetical protein GCM10027563_05860 [Parasphingorhabdus pacifica]